MPSERHAAPDALLHDRPQPAQAGPGLGFGPKGLLVLEHHPADGEAGGLAVRQELVAAGERVGQGARIFFDRRLPRGRVLVHHEAAAHRVVGAAPKRGARGVQGGEPQAVRVVGQALALEAAGARPRGTPPRAGPGRAGGSTAAPRPRGAAMASTSTPSGVSPRRPRITALSLPWPRPVAPRLPNSSARTAAVFSSRPAASRSRAKVQGRAHGPHGVRARGTDADLEEIEDADGHAGYRRPWPRYRSERPRMNE